MYVHGKSWYPSWKVRPQQNFQVLVLLQGLAAARPGETCSFGYLCRAEYLNMGREGTTGKRGFHRGERT